MMKIVMLSETKHLKKILRYAQNDKRGAQNDKREDNGQWIMDNEQ